MALEHREVHRSPSDHARQLQVEQKVGCDSAGKQVDDPSQSLVGKGLAHSVGDVLGTDAEDVQQLLRLPAAWDTAHCQSGHNNAGLPANCRQHSFTKTTWADRKAKTSVHHAFTMKVLLCNQIHRAGNNLNHQDTTVMHLQ